MRGRTILYALLGVAAVTTFVYARVERASDRRPLPSGVPSGGSAWTGKRVLLLGDSLAVGLASQMGALASRNGASFVAQAKSGTTFVQWRSEFRKALETYRPDVVVVSLGTNDAVSPSIEASKVAMEQMAADALTFGARLIWAGLPVMAPRIQSVDAMRAAIVGTGLPYYRAEAQDFPRAPDRIHFTGQGYADWANALWAWMTGVVFA